MNTNQVREAVKRIQDFLAQRAVMAGVDREVIYMANGCELRATDLDAVCAALAISPPVEGWISVKDRLPKCSKKPNSFGVQVLVYPPFQSEGSSNMPVAFYGCRQTNEPNFYMFGRVFDPEYWMPLPPSPNNQEVKPNPESVSRNRSEG